MKSNSDAAGKKIVLEKGDLRYPCNSRGEDYCLLSQAQRETSKFREKEIFCMLFGEFLLLAVLLIKFYRAQSTAKSSSHYLNTTNKQTRKHVLLFDLFITYTFF